MEYDFCVGKEPIPQFLQLLGDERDDRISRTLLIECEAMISYIAYYQAGYVIVTAIPLNANYEPHRACLMPPKDIDQVKAYPAGLVEAMSFTWSELDKDPDAWRRWIQSHHEKWCDDLGWAA